MTHSTSLSLLQRLRAQPAGQDWGRFTELYEPLLRSWLRRKDVLAHDSDDLVQNIMAVVVRRVPDFEHNGRPGAFRTWLRMITFNCIKEHWRERKAEPAGIGGSDIQTMVSELEDPESRLSILWNEEHDRHVMRHLLGELQAEFEPRTWLAFQRFALESKPAAEVAKELGITPNAVFIAKSRVLARLREESAGLLDEE
jgi:RNA polymerase sigma-70 factor, ECF subfamily